MITWDEMAECLGRMAVHDNRKGGDLDVDAWFEVAQDHGWSYAGLRRIIREHYGAGSDRPRLSASIVTDRFRDVERLAMRSFVDPVLPDPEPQDYPAWLREQHAAHKRARVAEWAATGVEPPAAVASVAGPDRLAAILAGAPESARPAIEAGLRQMGSRRP
jgi:hypothetical protein